MSLTGMERFLLIMRKLILLSAQACDLVGKFNLQILFFVQGNGKRRICNVEKNGRTRSLNSSRIRSCSMPNNKFLFSHPDTFHEKIATQVTVPAEVLCEIV